MTIISFCYGGSISFWYDIFDNDNCVDTRWQ